MGSSRYLDERYELAGRIIDPVIGVLTWQGESRHLRRKELEALALMAEAKGQGVSRQVFIDQLWRSNSIVGEQALNDTIAALRRSLPDKDTARPLIRTLPENPPYALD
jgi:DNA-binding winged helix-turn-helix (wHTH) protein